MSIHLVIHSIHVQFWLPSISAEMNYGMDQGSLNVKSASITMTFEPIEATLTALLESIMYQIRSLKFQEEQAEMTLTLALQMQVHYM